MCYWIQLRRLWLSLFILLGQLIAYGLKAAAFSKALLD